MRREILSVVLVTLVAVLLAGCSDGEKGAPRVGSTAYGIVPKEGDLVTAADVPASYLAACRATVVALRKKLGDRAVIQDVWPDIGQASVFVASPMRGGRAVVVTLTAAGPERCQAEIFVFRTWKQKLCPVIEKALGSFSPPVPATR